MRRVFKKYKQYNGIFYIFFNVVLNDFYSLGDKFQVVLFTLLLTTFYAYQKLKGKETIQMLYNLSINTSTVIANHIYF